MKRRKNNKIVGLLVVLLTLCVSITAVAQVEIPEGATIDYATLSVYVTVASGQTVNVHRVTADWQELTVTWNSFGGSYDAAIEGSFVADAVGWADVDVTDLVLEWADGTYTNHGVLLKQDATAYTEYASSEDATVGIRPMLEIGYTTTSGSSYVIIQRPGAEQDGVADAYMWLHQPDSNFGASSFLLTGLVQGALKDSLLRFEFTSSPPGGGGHTPGFWGNRNGQALIDPEDIDLLNDLCLSDDDGHIDEFADKVEFKQWLKKRRATNMAYQLSAHLAAMMLNVSVGFVDGDALVYYDGDMISIFDLMDDAAAALCADGYTPEGHPNRDDQEMLKDALDDANNNLNWVNP